MNLEQIKNDYAVNLGFRDWKDFTFLLDDVGMETHMDNICELAQKECLKRASENAEIKYIGYSTINSIVDKESITNENNIIK